MPIKLPKAFPRRKSSGHALEELTNPPEPSFRVFERPDRKSFDGGNTLKRMSQGRPLSAGHNLYADAGNPNLNNRGSGGTNNSSSSGGHDNSSSSARFSSSSTLPSSTDIPLDDKSLPNPHDPHKIPTPPIPATHPLSLRAGGRTFSFGRKKPSSPSSASPITQPPQIYSHAQEPVFHGRERALTESSYASGSTATPPKLLDTGLDLGTSDLDSFGDMFENFGRRTSTLGVDANGLGVTKTESPESISPAPGPTTLTSSYNAERPSFTPSPMQFNRSRDVQEAQPSPYSRTSHDSQDRLMDSPRLANVDHARIHDQSPPVPRHAAGSTPVRTMPTPGPNSPTGRRRQQRQSSYGDGLRRTSAYASRPESIPLQDEDAKLVMDSINASRRLNRHSGQSGEPELFRDDERDSEAVQASASLLGASRQNSSPRNLSPERRPNTERRPYAPVGLFDADDSNASDNWRLGSNETTPRAKTLELANRDKRSSLFDPSVHPPPRVGTSPVRDRAAKPGPQNKVMTPAQFERYRREQEIARASGSQSEADDSDDESDHYEDDDEAERNMELAKQRRKQEAHLAVYRQQMMKVTGEQPPNLPDLGPLRPAAERASASAPNIGQHGPTPTFTIKQASVSGKASDDEDDDVPLGVLAAHGFPNKNRPPGAQANNTIRYQSESYPPPPMSTSGVSGAGSMRGLPAFAKNLPPDPYYGAGLVNPSNREMPGFSNHGSGSQYGGASPNLHPGGLVGVIAGEERAKAMRRGSPNAQGNYGSQLPQGFPQMPPGMPPMISPGDEAQLQMSQQMTQMMQMQMQWMQQMQQMMASGVQLPQQMPPGMPGMSPMPPSHGQQAVSSNFLSPQGQIPRPMSHSAPSSPSLVQQQQQRAMSMMIPGPSPQWPSRNTAAPSMMSGALGPWGYAPSIAPSERSNIGQPSRYRPVSVAPIDEHPRPASRSSNNLLAPGAGDRKSTLTVSSGRKSTSPVPPKKVPSDDDDDEGWEEMKKKREQKASTWRTKKKGGNELKELYYPGM
ncbi:MAG: hypothetical protein L6R39_000486 [Caloplaca ligustica]|nr:MAG: hypothetical protein L6R39_000486 [Caloplaca ligustica]